jgi:hypothetical protein
MSVLEKWDRRIFTSSPFESRQAHCRDGIPREDLEEELVELCYLHPFALRLVVAMGFKPQFLSQTPRAVWNWLRKPEPMRHINELHRPDWPDMILVAADVHHRDQMIHAHGGAALCAAEYYSESRPIHPVHCPWCKVVDKRAIGNALGIASYLMQARAAELEDRRRQRQGTNVIAFPTKHARIGSTNQEIQP